MIAKTPVALAIAGSDSSAGAGLQADLKTFSALGVYGATVATAITAQNTLGIAAIHFIPADIISAQIDAVFSDLAVRAVKTGMLGSKEGIEATVRGLDRWAAEIPIVVDPVMVSTSGSRLLERDAESTLRRLLIPKATLLTPNLHEAAALLDTGIARTDVEARRQAGGLLALGAGAVLLKGGHGEGPEATDIFFDGVNYRTYSAPRIATNNTHGTGCTLASAIAAFLVKALPLEAAIAEGKAYLQGAIERAEQLNIGAGPGPICHCYHRQH